MKWRQWALGLLLLVTLERFCYLQTGSFSLSKMSFENSPPSPTSLSSSIKLEQPLRFIGAGKQFYAFETQDEKYVIKFMKWSRRRPLPWLEKLPLPFLSWKNSYLSARRHRAQSLQRSSLFALKHLPDKTQLVIPQPMGSLTLIDNLGISHTIDSSLAHFYVQRKAHPFTAYFQSHLDAAPSLLSSFIQTVAHQCSRGICNLDPVIERNYGVVDDQVILLDIGSFAPLHELRRPQLVQHEIVLELLPLRAWLQHHYPLYLETFDQLLSQELSKL